MNELLDTLSRLLTESQWLAPLAALLAGVLTSFTPCCLSTIPLVVGYVGGAGQRDTKKALRLSLLFALGSAITFTVLGVIAATAGRLLGMGAGWWYLVLGALMVLMALQTWGIFQFIPSSYLQSKSKRKGYAGAFLAGILGGIFSSPCSTPVLIVLLALVAQRGSLLWGVLLLLLYAVGHGVLTVIAGSSVGFVQRLTQNPRYGKFTKVFEVLLGTLLLLLGLYLFYLGF